jgi:hypothetical protein
MKKNQQITINNININIKYIEGNEYICLTDMVKDREGDDHIRNWMRNRNTIEFLGIWEQLNNTNFKPAGFDRFKKEVGLNSFTISPKKWAEGVNAIGIISKSGRYGGTYAHKDIAFEFASWISPTFKLYLIKEFQRLKEIESNEHNLEWSVKRSLSKTNYKLQTEAIKNYIIPKSSFSINKENLEYATEADMLNIAIFGYTAKEWKKVNSKAVLNGENIRDIASINELIVLFNLESINSIMIKDDIDRNKRFTNLQTIAQEQLSTLNKISNDEKSLKKIKDSIYVDSKKQLPK